MQPGPVIDLPAIKNDAVAKRNENLQFKTHLKNFGSKAIDNMVMRLNEEYSRTIDCTKCGNCCALLQPAIERNDIAIMAQQKMSSIAEFESEHTVYDSAEDHYYLKQSPCMFLSQKKCTIYGKRPSSCAEYPHLTKPDFKYRLPSVLYNYAICPIVYNVVEALKWETNFVR